MTDSREAGRLWAAIQALRSECEALRAEQTTLRDRIWHLERQSGTPGIPRGESRHARKERSRKGDHHE